MVGYVNKGRITASHATGSVTGESDHVGGLVGYIDNGGVVTASYASGSVIGSKDVGGLVGEIYRGVVTASYAAGSVTGNSSVGGLTGSIGYASGIANSYSVGRVTSTGYSRGLTGYWSSYATITDSYWDTQTTGLLGVSGGKTTREMQSPTGPTGIYANWNPEWWDFGTSRQYPALKYQGMDVAAQRQ